jgi:hypothetical protein
LRDASHASHNRLRNVSHNRPNASHDAGWLHEQRSSSTHRLSAFYLCCLLTLVPYIPTCSSSGYEPGPTLPRREYERHQQPQRLQPARLA